MSCHIQMRSLMDMLSQRGLEPGGRVQQFIGNDAARRCDKYVPLRAGPLKNTVQVLKSGREVRYVQIYSKTQYYSPRKPGSATGPLRGPKWFERMKSAEGKEILGGAAKMAGGKPEK